MREIAQAETLLVRVGTNCLNERTSSMPQKRRVLIIDDNLDYGEVVCRALRAAGFEDHRASCGTDGVEKVLSLKPDLILLDIHMKGMDGIFLHRAFRSNPATKAIPIILITGESVLDSILDAAVKGLQAEPVFRKDDDLEALLERVRSTLSPAERTLRKGRMSIDFASRQIWVDDEKIPSLPIKRFDLLCALMRRDGPASREELQKEVWGEHNDPKVVDMTISRLRQDLQTAKGIEIKTARHGYELVADGLPTRGLPSG